MVPQTIATILTLFGAIIAAAPACGERPDATRGLSVRADGVLLKDGRPFRAIGVNYFSVFLRHLQNPDETSYDAGFAALAKAGIPFVRFAGTGFWPVEQKLYRSDPKEFFRRFDNVVKSAEKHGVGLMPSFFWHPATVPDLVGEPVNQWGNPESKTRQYMRDYVRDVVLRYRASPAIWAWEFGNEFNLAADLPNAAEHRPPVNVALGTPPVRTVDDELSYATIRVAFVAFAREVRKHDPDRAISTGNSFPRPNAWHHWKRKSWTLDTPDQFAEMLRGDNPDPVDLLCVHVYELPVGEHKEIEPILARCVQLGNRVKKPLFIGEFGVPAAPDGNARFAKMLAAIESAGVPLAALWVYDYPPQDRDWNVTATNPRAYQLRAIAESNARIRASLNNPQTAD